MPKAVLVLDRGGERIVTLDQLRELPEPKSQGILHTPIPHAVLIDSIKRQFQDQGFDTASQTFALTRKDQRLFGVLDLVPSGDSLVADRDAGMAVGVRQSNDRSMSVQMVAGERVFVCSNLTFNGDVMALRRRHTTGVNLQKEMEGAVTKVLGHYARLNQTCERFRNTPLSTDDAQLLIYNAFLWGGVMAPKYLPFVHDLYFDAETLKSRPDCQPRTKMGVYNAFTRVIKDLPMARVQETTINLTRFFSKN